MTLKDQFIAHLRSKHSSLQGRELGSLVSENLLSPFVVELPAKVLTQVEEFVAAAFALRENSSYQQNYQQEMQERGLVDPGNKAIAMSYDFHVDENQNMKLIEVNTNASFLALGLEMYDFWQTALPFKDFSVEKLKEAFLTEMRLAGRTPAVPRIATIDDQPESQRLFIEFLVYDALFREWGWHSEIKDYRDLKENFDLVYNRYTDFYFSDPSSSELKKMFVKKRLAFSPHPFEYLLLADKQRMIDWSQEGFLERYLTAEQVKALRSGLPKAFELHSGCAEEIWSKRKSLFFKPKRAFGSKQSYKGSSISRKAFEEICNDDFIAQEYIPADEKNFETPEGPQSFKYDLRFYAYQGQVQLVVARLYQGQVTNLRTPYGGFACVRFT